HIVLVAGAVALYLAPGGAAAGMMLVGFFIRRMVPYAENTAPRLRSVISTFLTILLARWLMELGLRDLLVRAWAERFSPSPLIFSVGVVVYLLACDWLDFLRLDSHAIERFYDRRSDAPSFV